jgi:hypothetical protein
MPVTLELRRLRQEALEFEVSLSYIMEPYLKKKNKITTKLTENSFRSLELLENRVCGI